jgi:hypothetical protein
VLGVQSHVRAGQLAAVAPPLAQLGIERIDVAAGVSDTNRLDPGRRDILRPGRHKRAAGLVLLVGPG